jgi:hypothetical protein
LATKNVEDFNMGIRFLSALRRLYSLLGPRDEVEMTKKKLDIWSAKLEADIKNSKAALPKKLRDEDDGGSGDEEKE